MQEIALVNICYPKTIDIYAPPMGLMSIASFLYKNGIKSHIYDIATEVSYENFTLEKITTYLRNIKEDIIGLSAWDSVLPKIILAIKRIKKETGKTFILGGPSASTLAQEIIEAFAEVDFCIKGEGEAPLLNLLDWLNKKDRNIDRLNERVFGRMQNVVFRGKAKSVELQPRDIPRLDYSLCDIYKYNRFEISSSRGCSFHCEFCSVNSILGNKIRFRTMVEIFNEIERLFQYTDCASINIVDDNFGLIDSRLKEFCKIFKQRFPTKKWTCYLSLINLTKSYIDLISESGCVGVFVGIETGNEVKLRSFKKGNSIDEVLARIRYAASRIDVVASFIWGFPDESESQLLDTFDFINLLVNYDNIIVNLYQLSPLSGTPLTQKIKQSLVFDKEAISGFVFPHYLPDLAEEEVHLISQYPDIFSAFYHEDTELFGNKFSMVNKFLKNN